MTTSTERLNIHKSDVINDLERIERDGIDALIYYLESTDYFTAPASTKYHRCYEGGLLDHSFNVASMLTDRNHLIESPLDDNSVVICGYLHDLCKVGYYEKVGNSYRGVKGHPAAKSHGRLSIEIIENFIELTPIEKDIILYHMGLFGCYGYCVEYTPEELHKAIARNPMVQIFAACDMEESKWAD